MKLSDKQKDAIILMRKGWFGETSVVNNESAYFATEHMKGRKINIRVFNSLANKKLAVRVKHNFALYRYQLTELGKTIEL